MEARTSFHFYDTNGELQRIIEADDAHKALHEYIRAYGHLRNLDLSGWDLENVDLRDTDLSYTNLASTDLNGANLLNARVDKTDFQMAQLHEADLKFLRGRKPNFQGAYLQTADFRNAVLNTPDFRDAVWDRTNHFVDHLEEIPQTMNFNGAGAPHDPFRGTVLVQPKVTNLFRSETLWTEQPTLAKATLIGNALSAGRVPLVIAGLDYTPLFDVDTLVSGYERLTGFVDQNYAAAKEWIQEYAGETTIGSIAGFYLLYRMKHLIDAVVEKPLTAFTHGVDETSSMFATSERAQEFRNFCRRMGRRLRTVFSSDRQYLSELEAAMDRIAANTDMNPGTRFVMEMGSGYLMFCDSRNLEAALEEMNMRRSYRYGVNQQSPMSIIDPDAAGTDRPGALVYHKDGSASCFWFTAGGQIDRMARYEADHGACVASKSLNGGSAAVPEMFKDVAEMYRFRIELDRHARMPDDAPAYDPAQCTLHVHSSGHYIVRDIKNGKIHNPDGPAVRFIDPSTNEKHDHFFVDGERVPSQNNKPVTGRQIMDLVRTKNGPDTAYRDVYGASLGYSLK